MNTQKLSNLAEDLMKTNKLDAIFMTEDGQGFANEHDAKEHAKASKLPSPVRFPEEQTLTVEVDEEARELIAEHEATIADQQKELAAQKDLIKAGEAKIKELEEELNTGANQFAQLTIELEAEKDMVAELQKELDAAKNVASTESNPTKGK